MLNKTAIANLSDRDRFFCVTSMVLRPCMDSGVGWLRGTFILDLSLVAPLEEGGP